MAKKMQKDQIEESVESLEEVEEMAVEFEEWFAMREPNIPRHHKKEIIMADFKGRKLSMKETVEVFDKALNQYGVKLN